MSRILSVCLLLGVSIFSSFAQSYSGGQGTKENPYLINTSEDLLTLSKAVSSGKNYTGTHFKMGKDIDMKGTVMPAPIGNNYTPGSPVFFCGNFDGADHIIRNLVIENKEKMTVSLFGFIKGAVIENLAIDQCRFVGKSITGGLVGVMMGGTIRHCSVGKGVHVESTSMQNTGGVVSAVMGVGNVIEDCYNEAYVRGVHSACGGILGSDNSKDNATTKGLKILRCFNTGHIEDWVGQVGGIVGESRYGYLEIIDCCNFGRINAGEKGASYMAAGILGEVDAIEGLAKPIIKNCYNVGLIESNTNAILPDPISCAPSRSTISNCYYDAVSTGIANTSSATIVNLDDMKKQAFLDKLNANRSASPWHFVKDAYQNLPIPCKVFSSTSTGEDPLPQTGSFKPLFEQVTIPTTIKYAMLLKEYPSSVYDIIKQKNRIAIRLKSLTPDILAISDQTYTALKEGKGKIQIQIASVKPGSLDMFDEDNILGETSFDVIAESAKTYRLKLPAVPISWRLGPNEIRNYIQQNLKYQEFTSQYFKLVNVSEEQMKHNDMYLTGNTDFPLLNISFTNDTEAYVQASLYSASFRYIDEMNPLRKLLEKAGFEYRGFNESIGCNTYRNDNTKTSVVFQFVFLQGVRYGVISFVYDEDGSRLPASSEALTKTPGEITFVDQGESFEVSVPENAIGKNLLIYDFNGKTLVSRKITNKKLVLERVDAKQFIVSVKGCISLKVIR